MMNNMDPMAMMGGMSEEDPMAQMGMGPDPLLMELLQRAMSPEVDSQNYPSDMDPQLLELLRGIAPLLGMGMPQMGMDGMMGGMDPSMGMGGMPPSDPMMGEGMPPPEGMPTDEMASEDGGVPSVTPPVPPPPMPMPQGPPPPIGAMQPPLSTMMPQQPGQEPDPALMEQLMMRQMQGQGGPQGGY